MKTRAAVLYEAHEPLRIEELDLDEPKPGEVLVRVVATSICHSDLLPLRGDINVPLPVVMGHEGAGVVKRVGPGTSRLAPGDHVVMAGAPACGACRPCLLGRPYACEQRYTRNFGGRMADGTRRLRKDGQEISHFFCQSSFSEYAVVSESTAVKVREDAPLDVVCGFACGVATGMGAVINKAHVQAGSSVAVFGCGGVGLSVLMAARLSGAGQVIAVDVLESKLQMARELGATHVINGSAEDPVGRIREISGGGTDYAFECIGNVKTYAQVLEAIRSLGLAVVLGTPPAGSKVSIDPLLLMQERTITGCLAGDAIRGVDIPRWVDLYMQGQLPLDKLRSPSYTLSEINQAMEDLEKGVVVKPVIAMRRDTENGLLQGP